MAVSLKKGQGVSLVKGTAPLDVVVMGLGWDAAAPKGLFKWLGGSRPIDLDASCVALNRRGEFTDAAWYRKLYTRDKAIRHSGDNLSGRGDGDDERITVRLNAVPAEVATLIFTITSYTGQPFSAVANAYCRLIDARDGSVVARYDLGGGGAETGLVMARIEREAGGWRMVAVGKPAFGRTWHDLAPFGEVKGGPRRVCPS